MVPSGLYTQATFFFAIGPDHNENLNFSMFEYPYIPKATMEPIKTHDVAAPACGCTNARTRLAMQHAHNDANIDHDTPLVHVSKSCVLPFFLPFLTPQTRSAIVMTPLATNKPRSVNVSDI